MAKFNEFLLSLDPDAGKRGKQFEHFVKWFLKNDPEWSTQVDQVWLWDEYPDNWGRDCGIDLVFKHKNGENWAVQAKCYAPTTSITKADVDSFISESNRDGIDKRLLIATTDLIGANAKQVCDAQDKPVTRFLLSHFEDADIEYPATLDDLPKAKRKEKPKPRDHQIEAIEAVASNFKDVDRGKLIMACGTGKTFTTLWIKERLGVESTLVLLPSLGLLSQTLHEWTLAANDEFQVLCVCSDESVGRRGSDEAVHSIADLAFPVTSNAVEIKAFLNGSGKKVIFSTYQSSPLIAEAQSDIAVPAFDLAIADEAHRCAGKVSGDFSTILDGEKIRVKKRLFTTATPRTYSSSVKKAAEDRGVEVVGMDDEAVFGKQLFALNFGEAIKRGLLTDYRVVIIGVDDPTISAWIESRELLKADSDIEMDAESLAAQVGLLKAIKDYDLHRLISFHSRVSRAENFSKDIHKVLDWIDAKHKPSGELVSDFVSGEMPTDKRRRKLTQLKSLKDDQRGLLTNSRCLSEGVDVPSLDGVAFIDPRSSQIDIIQAVGRAIRLSPNKQAGTIILPVFVGNTDNPEQALEEGNFKPIWDVLNALKSHDDALSEEMNEYRKAMGRKPSSHRTILNFSKIKIDLPFSVHKNFVDLLKTRLVQQVTESWIEMYAQLEEYASKYGGGRVPAEHKTSDGHKLGSWVGTQRYLRNSMSKDRIKMLEAIPLWSWDLDEDLWNEAFILLAEYSRKNGDCFVPRNYKTSNGINLGTWVKTQRSSFKDLDDRKKERLESLSNWSWNPLGDKWDKAFTELENYSTTHNSSLVPSDHITSTGFKLGNWVNSQRGKKVKLSQDKVNRIEALPKWSWSPIDEYWELGFEMLKQYHDEFGNLLVSVRYKSTNGFSLGSWVGSQRANKNDLDPDKRVKLENLDGWIWDVNEERWEIAFRKLQEYALENKTTIIPTKYKSQDGFLLRNWITNQRRNKDLLDSFKRKRLEALPQWSWNPIDEKWDYGFSRLLEYAKLHKTSLLPAVYKDNAGFALGSWVSSQRVRRKKLTEEQIIKLEELPNWTWSVINLMWEKGYDYLSEYILKFNTSAVPARYKTDDGYGLGKWVWDQRKKRESLPMDQFDRLNALPNWVWEFDDGWDKGFSYLVNYLKANGTAKVPVRFITGDGYNLGKWASHQRSKKSNMDSIRKIKLEALEGWSWDATRIKRN
jgi:superfamily II DNA or RNA helicase